MSAYAAATEALQSLGRAAVRAKVTAERTRFSAPINTTATELFQEVRDELGMHHPERGEEWAEYLAEQITLRMLGGMTP